MASSAKSEHGEELRFAFDGDAVLFSDEAERIFKTEGLAAFSEKEKARANQPLTGGPFKQFLAALQNLQREFAQDLHGYNQFDQSKKGPAPAHESYQRLQLLWLRLESI